MNRGVTGGSRRIDPSTKIKGRDEQEENRQDAKLAATGLPVAWFPIALKDVATHPSGRTWAGSAANYVCLITLEGAEARAAPESPVP